MLSDPNFSSPANLDASVRPTAEPSAADGAAEDGAGQTAEPVVDGSDSTQIRSFFENLLNSTGDS